MERSELWSLIDTIARSHPPGALRLTPSELVEWLGLVAANKKADGGTRKDARRAAKHVPKLITGTYEMPNYSPPPEPAPPPAAAPKPDDFDADTPPPRVRPQGMPVPAHVVLPPGESLTGVFHDWDRKGRVPEGSVLARFVGVPLVEKPGTRGPQYEVLKEVVAGEFTRDHQHSGYVVEVVGVMGRHPLGAPGTVITPADAERYRVSVTVRALGSGLYAVLSPLGAA